MIKTLCVFCGSAQGNSPKYGDLAKEFGKLIARKDITLIYGGGNVGTMGTLADACMREGGRAIGIIPVRLHELVDHLELSELFVVPDMHKRKALMQEKSDAFVALPGGIGTMEELFEVWAWRYIGYHAKPVALLNVDGFYDSLLRFLSEMCDEGFLRRDILEDLIVSEHPGVLLEMIEEKIKSGIMPSLKVAELRRKKD
jgi:uncharacterized protein (TIGR00730 family)